MKLRFRDNSLRLRLNRREVETVDAGSPLEEHVIFPGGNVFSYILEPGARFEPDVSFRHGIIRICAPARRIREWAASESIGMYFEFPANTCVLKVAIEKDLECTDGPPGERDPEAFPRGPGKNC
ncbi:MAG TPA: hypothetical protein VH601_07810 [Bryobacteraceae bacterium]|jgi:hypothetical protein